MSKDDFSTEGAAVWFLSHKSNPKFHPLLCPWEDVSVVSAFIQQSMAHKHMLLLILILINQQHGHKFMTSPTQSVLP
jgi:hypothetical protein